MPSLHLMELTYWIIIIIIIESLELFFSKSGY